MGAFSLNGCDNLKKEQTDKDYKKSDSPKTAVKSTKSAKTEKKIKSVSDRKAPKSKTVSAKSEKFADGKAELKRQYIKKKAEAKQQAQQSEQEEREPENYAADTVETSARRSAETVYRDAETVIHKASERRNQRNDNRENRIKTAAKDINKPKTVEADNKNAAKGIKTAENYRGNKTEYKPNTPTVQRSVRTKAVQMNSAWEKAEMRNRANTSYAIAKNKIKTVKNYREGIAAPKTKQSINKSVDGKLVRDVKTKAAFLSKNSRINNQKADTANMLMRRKAAVKVKSDLLRRGQSDDSLAETTETQSVVYTDVQNDTVFKEQAPKAEGNPIKTESVQGKYIKTKDNYLSIHGDVGEIRSVAIVPKTQVEYLRKNNSAVQVVEQSSTDGLKTRQKYVRDKTQKPENSSVYVDDTQAADRSYNIHTELESKKNAEEYSTKSDKFALDSAKDQNSIKAETDTYGYSETVMSEKLAESEAPAVRIKTKENYLREHSAGGGNIKKASDTDIKAPKQNPHIIYHSREYAEKLSTSQPKTAEQAKNFKSKSFMRQRYELSSAANDKAKNVFKRRAQKIAAQRSAQKAKESVQTVSSSVKTVRSTAKTASKLTAKAGKAIAGTAKALLSLLSAAGGGIALIIALAVIIIIAAVASSPFGIYISGEVDDPENIAVSSIIAEANNEFSELLDELEHADTYSQVEITGEQADWTEVLAVFAVKYADIDSDDFMDVVIIDEHKKELLLEVFRDMNYVEYTIETVTTPSGVPDAPPKVEKKLFMEIKSKTAAEMADEYEFSDKQREMLDALLENREAFSGVTRSLAISDASATEVIRTLPNDLPIQRKNVVKAACSLVGKVNYFWGGKSEVLGWDSEWGKMRRVTAAGSSSSGTTRPFGLDCSGFVTWAFVNSGISSSSIGHGTVSQNTNCSRILWRDAQPGDLAFYADLSHVGIVAGRDTDGNVLVIHCSSGSNNVVITTNSGFGFVARPRCY